jgi:hypothetical protein
MTLRKSARTKKRRKKMPHDLNDMQINHLCRVFLNLLCEAHPDDLKALGGSNAFPLQAISSAIREGIRDPRILGKLAKMMRERAPRFSIEAIEEGFFNGHLLPQIPGKHSSGNT